MWIKHPRTGKHDTMLTLSVWATISGILKFLVSGVEIGSFKFGTLDPVLLAALLAATLGSYVARKHKDSPDEG